MRGSPLLTAAAMAVALALVGIPVWCLTQPPAVAAPAAPPTEASRAVQLTVQATSPADLRLDYAGRTIWQATGIAAATETEIPLPDPAATVELVAVARWHEPGEHAARVRIERDGELLGEITLWGAESATEILTVSP